MNKIIIYLKNKYLNLKINIKSFNINIINLNQNIKKRKNYSIKLLITKLIKYNH